MSASVISLDVRLDFSRLDNMLKAAGKNRGPAVDRAVNRAATMARTAMTRVLVPQTGLKYRSIRNALKLDRATGGGGVAVISSRGGDIRLKFFGPRVVRAGVSAAPRSSRRTFAGKFMRGGVAQTGKAVLGGKTPFERVGSKRLPIRQARSDVRIPEEMIRDASASAFYSSVADVLPRRLMHELMRVLG